MKLQLLYFARLREEFGLAQEELALTGDSVADLLHTLRERGGDWARELASGRAFRVAVNQDLANQETRLNEGDEVAIFPPVTGG